MTIVEIWPPGAPPPKDGWQLHLAGVVRRIAEARPVPAAMAWSVVVPAEASVVRIKAHLDQLPTGEELRSLLDLEADLHSHLCETDIGTALEVEIVMPWTTEPTWLPGGERLRLRDRLPPAWNAPTHGPRRWKDPGRLP